MISLLHIHSEQCNRVNSAPGKPAAIERSQLRGQEVAVTPNEFVIEVNFAAAVVRSLDIDHIPMDLASVSIVGVVVRLTGRKVERTRDLFVEENVAHGMQNIRIKSEREFPDVARSRIRIENLV